MPFRGEVTTISVSKTIKEDLEHWFDHKSWDDFMKDVINLLNKYYPE